MRTLFIILCLFSSQAFSYGNYWGFPKTWDFNSLTVQGQPVGAHRGALVWLGGAQSIPSGITTTVLFAGEAYDTDSIHDTSSNTGRLTVPADVSYVRLSANIQWDKWITEKKTTFLYRNGSLYNGPPKVRFSNLDAGTTIGHTHVLDSPIIPVSPGDYFEIRVNQANAVARNVDWDSTWFAMEIIQ